MTPLPKWAGLLGYAATLYGSLEAAGVFNTLSPAVKAIVTGVGGLVVLLSHSLTGTGGQTAPAK